MARRDQEILRAAERLFHERSFDGTGIDAIGREVGIVGSGVYRYFTSKDEILLTLLEGAADELEAPTAAPPGTDPRDELDNLIRTHVGVACRRRELVGIWQRERHNLAGPAAERFHARERAYVDRWVSCLTQCYPGHSRAELVSTVLALHALMTSDSAPPGHHPTTPPTSGELLIRLAQAALTALEPGPGPTG